MSHSDEIIKVDDYVCDAIHATRNLPTRPPSDGTLDAGNFCGLDASANPQRGLQGVTRQGSGEQIVKDCRDKEQVSLKVYRETEEDKVRPPVSTFSARGDEVNYNVLRGQESNEETLFRQDNFQETENLANCKSHHDIKVAGSDSMLRRPRAFSSDGDLMLGSSGAGSARRHEDLMPIDLESGKGVRRKGEGKGSKHQQSSKAQNRRPNVSEHKETLTYADDSKSEDADGRTLSREEQIRLKEESFIRQTFWIRGPNINPQDDIYDPDRSIGSSARSLPSSRSSSRDSQSSDSSSEDSQSRASSRHSQSRRSSSRDSQSSGSSRHSQSRHASRDSQYRCAVSSSASKDSARGSCLSKGSQTDGPSKAPSIPVTPSKEEGSPNKSQSPWSPGSPVKFGICRLEQLKELSRDQLEALAESLVLRVEELCDASVDDTDDKEAPGWVWRQRHQEVLGDMEEQARLIQTLQQEKAVLVNSFYSMEYCLLSVQREMREEQEKAKKARYKLVTDMAASRKPDDELVHRAIDMMNKARMDSQQLFCQLQEKGDKVTELSLLLQRLQTFTSSLQHNMRCLRYQHIQDCHMDVAGSKLADVAEPPPAPNPCFAHKFSCQQEVVDYIEGDSVERTYERDISTDIRHNLSVAMQHCKQALCSDLYHEEMCLQGPECPKYQMELYL